MRSTLSRNSNGYTLVELAISLTIGGIILVTVATSVHIYLKNQAYQTTLNNISMVTAALNNYLIQTGSYPCPAPIDVPRSNPQYGIAGDCTDGSVPAGSCGRGNGNGYCVQQSDRQLNGVNPLPAGWTGRVRRGGVPFRTLDIPEYSTTDGYKDRLEYGVTEALAVQATYNQHGGAIDIVDGNKNPLVTPLPGFTGGTTHYVVISNGPDRAGAYSFETGALVAPCPALGSTLDAANCQTGSLLPPAIFNVADYADAKGASHFDDTVKYYSAVQSPVWRVAGTLGLDIVDPVQAGDAPTAGKIGIGVNPGTSGLPAALQVNGNVRAENNINTSQLCASGNQANCSAAAPLTSACPPGQVATGFNAGHMQCVKDLQVVCPAGQVMTGIDPKGNLICQTAVGCPVTSTQMCWNAANASYNRAIIPAALLNAVFTTPTFGDSYKQSFQCRETGSNAQWVNTGTSGVCLCTPASNAPVTQSCSQYMGDNCPNCWAGVANFTQNVTCPGGATSQSYVSNTCQCQPYTSTFTNACPAGQTGSITYSQDYTCDPSNPSAEGTWGEQTQTNNCVCDPAATTTQTITCQAAGYSAGYSGSVTQVRQHQCPDAWGVWRTTSDTCACTGATQYQTIGCPAPQTGTQNQSQTFNCTTNSWGPWATDSNSCGARAYTWQTISSQIGPVIMPLGNEMGGACSTQGAIAPCSAAAGKGTYWQYSSCECE